MKVEIDIPAPLPQQVEPLADPTRFKLWRWGRRTGKTDGAFIAATIGHGPGKGFLTGGEIVWVPRDYGNADKVWRLHILKRFANKPGFHVDKKNMRLTLEGREGSLTVQSAENIDSSRGGAWDGVIIDEGAHLDLDYVHNDVIRPGLADRIGWEIIMSTTKPGSYFNTLCERVMEGKLESWKHWHLNAYSNPKIQKGELDDLVAEYADEFKLKCEVFAELIVPGGFAFPEWRSAVHVMKLNPPKEWTWAGCMDWGYMNPGYFGVAALGPDREVYFRKELKFQETEPFDVGVRMGILLGSLPSLVYIAADAQMWGRDQSEITIADQVQDGLRKILGDRAPALIPAPKGPGSRERGTVAMHQALAWTPHPDDPNKPANVWKAPRLRFHEDCAYAITSIPKLARDPNNAEVPDTKGDDHAWDAVKGLLLLHNPHPIREGEETPQGRHPGLDPKGRRKSRWEPEEDYVQARYHRARSPY